MAMVRLGSMSRRGNVEETNTAFRKKYVIGFTIHEAKELSKDGVAVDPLVVARALGREYKTDLKRGKLQHCKFEESYIWSDLVLNEDEFSIAHLEFELQSANIFFRNDVIGVAKVQLAMVRKRPNHCYSLKWLQLTQDTALTARLKVSVFCYAEGDTPPRPEDIENDADEMKAQLGDLSAAVLGEGKGDDVHRQAYHLFIHVHRAEHLGGGTENYNPYISIEFNGFDMKTQPARDTNTINFDECFRIPVMTPIFADAVVIRVWNHVPWGTDTIIVQGRLSFSLLRMHAMVPKWFNFWGFSDNEVGDVDGLLAQQEKAEENYYLGRLLISGRVQKVVTVQELLKPAMVKGQIFEEPPTQMCHLMLDVYEVSGVPGTECYIQITVGKKSKKTKVVRRHPSSPKDAMEPGRFIFDDGKGRVQTLNTLLEADKANQLDIMISMYANLPANKTSHSGLIRVGFLRIKAPDVPVWKGEMSAPTWRSLKPMAHLPSSIEPGQMLISLHQSAEPVEERGVPNVKPLDFELRAYVLMARNLVSQDDGVPHAFVSVTCAGVTKRTETKPETASPNWCEVLTLDIKLQASLSTQRVFTEPIQVKVYDDIEDKDFIDVKEEVKELAKDLRKAKDRDGLKGAFTEDKEELINKGKQRLLRHANHHLDRAKAAIMGDVMAKKRLGQVAGGKQLIGRANIKFHRILRPPPTKKGAMRPKWIMLKGGLLGSGHCGDILVGFQLMKKKYSGDFEVERTKPEGQRCMLSVSVLGLRNVVIPDTDSDGALTKPVLQIEVPQPSLTEEELDNDPDSGFAEIEYSKKPQIKITPDDTNRMWSNGKTCGFEMLEVRHMEVTLPLNAKFEATMRLRLLGDTDQFLGEGVISLAEVLPWVKKQKGKLETMALDRFQLDSSEDDVENAEEEGVPVSDIEGDGESAYTTVEIQKEPTKLSFDASDDKTFPPVVTWLDESSAAKKVGIAVGDWLVSYQTPLDQKEKACAHWSPKQTSQFLNQMDSKRVRPLKLRFRRKDKQECAVRIPTGNAGVKLVEDDDTRPPQIEKDISKEKHWKKSGVDRGWRIVDINGFCTEEMTYASQQFQTLFEMRPIIFTCRMHGKAGAAAKSSAAEKKLMENKPVLLNGCSAKLVKENNKKAMMKDGCLRYSRAPRPTPHLMPVNDPTHMIIRVARGALLDVRGVIHATNTNANEDADETRSRPSVPGKLEEYMTKPDFIKVPLINGKATAGYAKIRLKVISPCVNEWWKQKQYKDRIESKIYDPECFRRRYKAELPSLLRVRTYIVRGLNVSGAHSGYGNPYMYFVYGSEEVHLKNKVQMATVEPRFFHTEERDISLPEAGYWEAGLYDWMDGTGADVLIGKTTLDLEDRWYTEMYQDYVRSKRVPIEYRSLENAEQGSAGAISKGAFEMWMEIIPSREAAEIPVSPLFQPPPVEVEIRLILWDVDNISRRLCIDEHTLIEREKVDVIVRASIDSKCFKGPQDVRQETDVHYSCVDHAEFNWRFIWSRIAVTKGVPLDCQLQVSLWEQFALQRPKLMAEALIEMKNYCKKVSQSNTLLDVEADLPLHNSQLTKLLREEREHMGPEYDEDTAAEENGENESEYSTDALVEEEKENKALPPAAVAKVRVQVWHQTEASSGAARAGLGRKEPNRDPVLPFPKEGRTWQATLPATAAIIEAVSENFMWAKYRCRIMCSMLLVVGLLVILHSPWPIAKANGCAIMYRSCLEQCPRCYKCAWGLNRKDIEKSKMGDYCYHLISQPTKCLQSPLIRKCNIEAEIAVGNQKARCSATFPAEHSFMYCTNGFLKPDSYVATTR